MKCASFDRIVSFVGFHNNLDCHCFNPFSSTYSPELALSCKLARVPSNFLCFD